MDEHTIWERLRENFAAAEQALAHRDLFTLRLLAAQEALLLDEMRIMWRTREHA